MPFLEGLDTLVINALHRKTHFSHLNLSEAIALSERIGAGRTFLTHLSHDMGRHADVLKELPQRISLAYDGLSISIS
jgi:phosphoribosyl 1,2-cyclic phosphate phosphodiesterase